MMAVSNEDYQFNENKGRMEIGVLYASAYSYSALLPFSRLGTKLFCIAAKVSVPSPVYLKYKEGNVCRGGVLFPVVHEYE